MPSVSPFHSVKEVKKPPASRVHHNNSACNTGRDIPRSERKQGDGGYRMCHHCDSLNKQRK
jgi:hypothetical protein